MSSDVLAIDLGTTGVKVAIVGPDGAVQSSAGETFPMLYTNDGGVEQDAENWWRAIGRCTRRALNAAGKAGTSIGVVAVTSQYMSTVAIDERGRPLMNTVMWMDRRGRDQLDVLRDPDAPALWLDLHGLPPPGDLGHIAFIRNERPDVYARAAALVEPVDYLNARLTGRITATQNTAFGLLTVDNRVH